MDSKQDVPAALGIEGIGDGDARAGFDIAADAGYRGVAFATNHRELNPEALGATARRHVRTILAGKGLSVESLRAAAPRGGLADTGTIDRTLENARKAMNLARELGVKTVTLNIGRLGDNAQSSTATNGGSGTVPEGTLVMALRELAQHADAAGLTLALGSEGAMEALARVIKQVDFDGARVNLDGARLIGAGDDLLAAVDLAGERIGQWTATDAVRAGNAVRAVMLGEGQAAVRDLAATLDAHGFRGPVVVDVRDLPDGAAGARHAAEMLRRILRR